MELKSVAQMMKNFMIQTNTSQSISNKHTIICLHGYMSNESVFIDFKNKFKTIFNVICIKLPTLHLNVNDLTKLVEDFLITNNIQDFSIVGHSLGSIVALNHQFMIGSKKAKVIICVASPLFGSSLHKFMYGPNNIDLYIHSNILTEIRKNLSLYKHNNNIVFIQALNDMLINKFYLQDIKLYTIDCGHVGILIHPIFLKICQDILHS